MVKTGRSNLRFLNPRVLQSGFDDKSTWDLSGLSATHTGLQSYIKWSIKYRFPVPWGSYTILGLQSPFGDKLLRIWLVFVP